MNNRYKAKRVRPRVNKFIVDILLNNVVRKNFGIGKDLTRSLKAGAPEAVLLLKTK